MFNIEDYKQIIAKICEDLKVRHLDLVGSASRQDFQSETSDIDVVVEFVGIDRLFDRYFELKTRLEEQFGRQVDVIQESGIKNPYVRKDLNRDKVRLYASRS